MANNILIVANQLALKFSEYSDIPSRFDKGKTKKEDKKTNLNTMVEKRFKENIEEWKQVIETMLEKIDNKQAWRFISIKPNVESEITSAAYSKDYSDFTDYFILRRNKENCKNNELGLLALLLNEFQKEIDRQISEKSSSDI